MKKVLLAIISTALLAGCSEPTIDAATHDSIKSSAAKVRDALPESKRSEFDESMEFIISSQVNFGALFLASLSAEISGETENKTLDVNDFLTDNVKHSLHGKTGEEIIGQTLAKRQERKIADRVKQLEREQKQKDREQKQKVKALQEIKELEAKSARSVNSINKLKSFKVISSRFYKQKQEYSGDKPIIEITVMNGTDYPISRAYLMVS